MFVIAFHSQKREREREREREVREYKTTARPKEEKWMKRK